MAGIHYVYLLVLAYMPTMACAALSHLAAAALPVACISTEHTPVWGDGGECIVPRGLACLLAHPKLGRQRRLISYTWQHSTSSTPHIGETAENDKFQLVTLNLQHTPLWGGIAAIAEHPLGKWRRMQSPQ
eukprot:6459928-Amphidinium_carterae.1